MKVIKLTGNQMRRWRTNQTKLVDAAGNVARDATPEEKAAEHKARQQHQRLVLKEGDTEYRLMPDRELIKREMFDLHGEVQLRRSNGTFLCAIRDPRLARPKPEDTTRIAPPPDQCQCKSWGEPHPGKHHPICEFNTMAPPTERGDIEVSMHVHRETSKPEEVKPVIRTEPAMAPRTQEAPKPEVRVPSPEECSCKAWQKPDGADPDNHHPICEWFERWQEVTNDTTSQWVIDLDTGEPLRRATRGEVEIATAAIDAGGAPTIKIGVKTYAIGDVKDQDVPEEETVVEVVKDDSSNQPRTEPVEEPTAESGLEDGA